MKQLIYYAKTDQAQYFLYHKEVPEGHVTYVIRRQDGFTKINDNRILKKEIKASWQKGGDLEAITDRVIRNILDFVKSWEETIIFDKYYCVKQ